MEKKKIELPAGIPESEREEFENVLTQAEAARQRVNKTKAAKAKPKAPKGD